MPKKKKTEWIQRCPPGLVEKAQAKAMANPDSKYLGLDQRNKFVNWLLERFGSGKLQEVKK